MSCFSLPYVTSNWNSSCYHAESDTNHQPADEAHRSSVCTNASSQLNGSRTRKAHGSPTRYLSPGDDDLGRFGIIRVGERVVHDADASNYSARRTRHALREVAGVTDQHRRLRHLPHNKSTTIHRVQAGVQYPSQRRLVRSLPNPQRSQRNDSHDRCARSLSYDTVGGRVNISVDLSSCYS